jgi:hypothetical protein
MGPLFFWVDIEATANITFGPFGRTHTITRICFVLYALSFQRLFL